MFVYQKKLQYPVKIATPNPKLASIIISQYGGPDGELGASLRYLSQRFSMPYPELKGLLTDIGTSGAQWRTRSLLLRTNVFANPFKRFSVPPAKGPARHPSACANPLAGTAPRNPLSAHPADRSA